MQSEDESSSLLSSSSSSCLSSQSSHNDDESIAPPLSVVDIPMTMPTPHHPSTDTTAAAAAEAEAEDENQLLLDILAERLSEAQQDAAFSCSSSSTTTTTRSENEKKVAITGITEDEDYKNQSDDETMDTPSAATTTVPTKEDPAVVLVEAIHTLPTRTPVTGHLSRPGAIRVSNRGSTAIEDDILSHDLEEGDQEDATNTVAPLEQPGAPGHYAGSLPATLVVEEEGSDDRHGDRHNCSTCQPTNTTEASGSDTADLEASFTEASSRFVLVEGQPIPSTRRNHFMVFSVVGILFLLATIVLLTMALAGVFFDPNHEELLEGLTTTTTTSTSLASPTLARIQKEKVFRCAHTPFIISEFEQALCHVLGAAMLGKNASVELVPIPMQERFAALDKVDVDVLIRVVTHTLEREVYESSCHTRFAFSTPYLYVGTKIAGDPFYVHHCADQNLKHLDECWDWRICVVPDSTTHMALARHLPERSFVYYDSFASLMAHAREGNCNTVADELYALSETSIRTMGYQGDYALSKSYFAEEPLSIVTRRDDPIFSDFVNSVLEALLVAELHNITQDNAQERMPQTNLFGKDYTNMFQDAIGFGGHFGNVYDTYLADFFPRDALNTLHIIEEENDSFSNSSNGTGLLMSHPFGHIQHRRDVEEEPLDASFQAILDRGFLRCGVRTGAREGFASRDIRNVRYWGIEVDYCRALAAALFWGDTEAIEYVEFHTSQDGFLLISDGTVDVIGGATRTLQTDVKEPTTGQGFAFSQAYFYGYNEQEDNLCLATRQKDNYDWSTFVYWVVSASIYAEEQGINATTCNRMPEVMVYGDRFHRMFRDAILAIGNYQEIYDRNLELLIPRAGRNRLNTGPSPGPQHYPLPGFFER